MDNKIYNFKKEIKKLNIPENKLENDIYKKVDTKTTNEDDSIYYAEEIISYCSSPTSGIVSIKNTQKNNLFINIGSEISNITNTITLNISMIKNEINKNEKNIDILRSKSNINKENKEKEDNEDKNNYINKKSCSKDNSQNDKDKKDKNKSFFKKKIKRIKDNKIILNKSNEEMVIGKTNHIIKKLSKVKKKKPRKSLEMVEEKKNYQHCKSSNNIEKDNNLKKNKKKTHKARGEKDFDQIIKKKFEMEKEEKEEKKEKEEKEEKKEKENKNKNKKEIDDGKSPKIIILDFSSSVNNEENDEDSLKYYTKSKDEEKYKDNYNNNNLNYIFKKNEENEFFSKKNKTKNENDDIIEKNKNFNNEFITQKLSTPKSKKSCIFASKTYKIYTTHSYNRKLSANFETNSIIKSNTTTKIGDLEKNNKINKNKNSIDNDFFKICASRHFNHNEDYQNKIINTKAIKENIRKRNKKKHKKNLDKLNSRKDSNKSCHNTPNKKFRHIISHNYDKKTNNLDKKLNINILNNNKISEALTLSHTPKNFRPKKELYASNRNLTNIKISSQAVENKDIHLEMNGKQETIINYTNQEMVDDENEYMVECFKILLKLDKSKQPRCKNKVNFNFENSPTEKNKKKIALFDLDETLVHCTKEKKGLNGDSVNIKLPTNKIVNVGLNIRPLWKEALDLIKNHYHIVIYTASHQSYADAVLDYLDKENKYFQYRLYRNHCVQCDIDGIKFYVKDLDTLTDKYDLKDVVLIDNSVLSFAYHLNNGIPIVPYIEQKEDSQLLMLAYYLVSIANYDDLTEENKKHINIEHFLLEVKDLENEESEENDENDVVNENDNNNENNNDKEINDIIIENKSEDNFDMKNEDNDNDNNNDNNDKNDNNLEKEKNDENNFLKINNPNNNDYNKREKKLSIKRSEKALKIANDMKQNMADIYNKNYN